ncbi:MAG: YdiY family protein [Desulfurivibrionaceae bacterium]
MNRLPSGSIIAALSLILSTTANSDIILHENGSRIIGNITKIHENKVIMETDFADTVTVDLNDTTDLETNNPLFISLENDSRLYGTMNQEGDTILIDSPEGRISVNKNAITAAWLKGQPDPLAPERRAWSYEISLEGSGKTGNTERGNIGTRLKAELEGPDDQLQFYLQGRYAKEEGEETDDEIIAGIDFERIFAEIHSWYTRIELERDDIDDLDLRTTAATGYGYYFLKKSDHELRTRLGLSYRHDSLEDGSSSSDIGLDMGLHYMYRFNRHLKLVTDITYTPSLEDFADYLLDHESILETPVALSEIWKLQVGINNQYDSEPAEGKEKLDTTYFGRLVLQWKD